MYTPRVLYSTSYMNSLRHESLPAAVVSNGPAGSAQPEALGESFGFRGCG